VLVAAAGELNRQTATATIIRSDILKLTPSIRKRASELETIGFKPADAVHDAAAEQGGADVLLSCLKREN
jgi:hypothetical protein